MSRGPYRLTIDICFSPYSVKASCSFLAEQYGVLMAACSGSVAENPAQIVDCQGIRKRKAGARGDKRIEIDQASGGRDDGDMPSRPVGVVEDWGEDCRPHDLACSVDGISGCLEGARGTDVFHSAASVQKRMEVRTAEIPGSDHFAEAVYSMSLGAGRKQGCRVDVQHAAVAVKKRLRI